MHTPIAYTRAAHVRGRNGHTRARTHTHSQTHAHTHATHTHTHTHTPTTPTHTCTRTNIYNAAQILDVDPADHEEEGANVDLDSTRKGKCAVVKTSTRQVWW